MSEARLGPAQSAYLDLLRGLAAQLVLLHHTVAICLPSSGLDRLGGGALGVLVFFLLSGFLITGTVASRVASGRFSLTEFTVSRATRIFLPYVPALVLVALLDRWMLHSPVYSYTADYTAPTAVANLFMLQDFPPFQILRRLGVPDQAWFFKTFGSGRQFWTVSIEWWIYLTVGIGTALALTRRGAVWWGVLAFVAIEPLYNLVGGPGDCLTLAWLLGAGAWWVVQRAALPGAGLAWAGCVVLAGTRLFFTHGRIYDAVFALLLAAVLFVPLLLLRGGRLMWLTRLRFDRLSFHSYSLYLTHGTIGLLLVARLGDAAMGWPGVLLVVVLCNLVAIPFAAAFELPQRRVRRLILDRLSAAQPALSSGSGQFFGSKPGS